MECTLPDFLKSMGMGDVEGDVERDAGGRVDQLIFKGLSPGRISRPGEWKCRSFLGDGQVRYGYMNPRPSKERGFILTKDESDLETSHHLLELMGKIGKLLCL